MKKRIIDSIVEVFQKQGNPWLNYNQIYQDMDQSVFGPNKHGERGMRNIVYRLLLAYSDMFQMDENYRPKKFRLALDNNKSPEIEVEKKYSTGDVNLYVQGELYEEVAYTIEKDFEEEIKDNFKLIFGENSHYYDVRKKIGKRICDALVYDEELGKVLIIENELFIHDLWGHIIPQIIDFFNGMRDEETKMKLKYDVSWEESHRMAVIEAIDKAAYEIVVVIDRITFDIKRARKDINELIKHFVGNKDIKIHFKEFKVFVSNEGKKIFQVV